MRIGVLTPFPVLPLTHGGRVRTLRLAASLSDAGATVTLACPWAPGLRSRPFRTRGVRIVPFVAPANLVPAILGDRLVTPLAALSWVPARIADHVLRSIGPVDVIQLHFPAQAALLERAGGGVTRVYVAHNVEADYARTYPPLLAPSRMVQRVTAIEQRAFQGSDIVVACTTADANRLQALYGERPVVVAPNGYEPVASGVPTRETARAALGIGEDERVVVFVGGPAAHNRHAVRAILELVMPELGSAWRLMLVGGSSGEGAAAAGSSGVLRLGFVENLASVLAAADVAVNPSTHGMGSHHKIADYLASRLPVVTTPEGARGFESVGAQVIVAPITGFAAAIRAATASGAIADLPADLAWSAIGARLLHAYGAELARRR